MKNSLVKKGLVIGIIVLFIGVSYSSAISIDTKSTLADKQSEDDCGCKEIDDRQLGALEKQLKRVEVYTKLLLVLSKNNPELKEISEELSNRITILTDINSNGLICDILESLFIKLTNIHFYFEELISELPEDSIYYKLALILCGIVFNISYPIFEIIAGIALILYCDWAVPDYPLY